MSEYQVSDDSDATTEIPVVNTPLPNGSKRSIITSLAYGILSVLRYDESAVITYNGCSVYIDDVSGFTITAGSPVGDMTIYLKEPSTSALVAAILWAQYLMDEWAVA